MNETSSGQASTWTEDTLGTSVMTPSPASGGGLSTGAIVGIVIAVVAAVGGLMALIIWLALKWKRKRQLEGKYCPAAEEQKVAAKNLPPLPNPAIEGLI